MNEAYFTFSVAWQTFLEDYEEKLPDEAETQKCESN